MASMAAGGGGAAAFRPNLTQFGDPGALNEEAARQASVAAANTNANRPAPTTPTSSSPSTPGEYKMGAGGWNYLGPGAATQQSAPTQATSSNASTTQTTTTTEESNPTSQSGLSAQFAGLASAAPQPLSAGGTTSVDPISDNSSAISELAGLASGGGSQNSGFPEAEGAPATGYSPYRMNLGLRNYPQDNRPLAGLRHIY